MKDDLPQNIHTIECGRKKLENSNQEGSLGGLLQE